MTWDMLSPRYVSDWVRQWYNVVGYSWWVMPVTFLLSFVVVPVIFGIIDRTPLREWPKCLGAMLRRGWDQKRYHWEIICWVLVVLVLDLVYGYWISQLRLNPNILTVGNSLQSLSSSEFQRATQLLLIIYYWGLLLLVAGVVISVASFNAILPPPGRPAAVQTGGAATVSPPPPTRPMLRPILINGASFKLQWLDLAKTPLYLSYDAQSSDSLLKSDDINITLFEIYSSNGGLQIKKINSDLKPEMVQDAGYYQPGGTSKQLFTFEQPVRVEDIDIVEWVQVEPSKCTHILFLRGTYEKQN